MILFKNWSTQTDKCFSLIAEGKTRDYGYDGRFLRQRVVTNADTMYAVRVNIISIVNSNNYTEICIFTGNHMSKLYTPISYIAVVNVCVESQDFIKILSETGTDNGIHYNRALFVYNTDVDLQSKFNNLDVRSF